MPVLILNGPNLNLLGLREPEIYGATTYPQLETQIQAWGESLGLQTDTRQSNHEGQLIDWIQAARGQFQWILFNPGGYTHTSVALRDALSAVQIPTIEIHLSNIFAREEFRQHSYISPVCRGVISGLGVAGYFAGLQVIAMENS